MPEVREESYFLETLKYGEILRDSFYSVGKYDMIGCDNNNYGP